MKQGLLGELGNTAGCLAGVAVYVGGPLLTAWICISLFGWPAWVGVMVALTVGGFVSHLILMAIVLPIAGASALMKSRSKQGE